MLARANRVTRPIDFRTAVRRGRRIGTSAAVLHVLERPGSEPSRFGFIVAKSVGGAVTRNLVRRRLRAVSRDMLPTLQPGTDVVMRALPGSELVAWPILQAEIAQGLERFRRAS
ncbi:MAG: ribonuclease P protein component [Salinibacterium sp.]|nr:ribonuclease P protein component [Salinibacterium sp.]